MRTTGHQQFRQSIELPVLLKQQITNYLKLGKFLVAKQLLENWRNAQPHQAK